MTFDFLPPQAYTKETLLKAYNWLQNQSEQVKELATTPDQLVSLYLKSSRLGQDSLQRYATSSNQTLNISPSQNATSSQLESPDRPSLQSFKSELKNLAGMMGDLEKPVPPPPTAPVSPSSPMQNSYVSASAAYTNGVQSPSAVSSYDEMTLNLIREVKNELNLSTDAEAVRMLVKIGYQKVRSLYK